MSSGKASTGASTKIKAAAMVVAPLVVVSSVVV
jgi:hypothetical protein